jgi:ABC-2 type transport system permease protein
MTAFQEYWRVLCLHIRMQTGLSALSAKRRKRLLGKETLKMVGYGFLILYAVSAVLLVYSFVVYPFMKGAAEIEGALGISLLIPIMGIIVLLCMIVVMIFGTLTLLSLVFGARDAEAYAALPLREQSVFAAKFTMAYGIELAVTALFLWPPVVIYGIVSGLPVPAFLFLLLRALPVWLLLPSVPMALAALVSMIFTRLTALSRHRDKLMMVFGMALVIAMVGGQAFFAGRLTPVLGDMEQIERLLTDNSAMLESVTGYFPPATWSAQALIWMDAAGAGMGFLGIAACAVAGSAVCLLLSRRLYYKGVLAQMEAPKGRKKGYKQDAVKTGGAMKALFSKEMKVILRTPVYAMNILMGVAILPLMLAVISLGQGAGGAMGGLEAVLESLAGEARGEMFYWVAAGVVMMTAVMGSTCVSTSFSREGRMLWISQTAPVTAQTQVAARMLCGFALTAAGAALALTALVAFAGFTVWEAVFGMVAGCCAAFPLLAAAIIPDALKPKRKWNSEAEAMKQNFNSVLALLINLGMAAVIGAAAVVLGLLLPVWAAAAVVAAGCLAAGYAVFIYAARLAENMMKTVEG